MAAPLFDNVPQEYKDHVQWVLWKTITRAGRLTKVPYRPNGIEADSSDPATWSKYDVVVEAYHKGGYDGIGFVFDTLDPYAGVDLDHCINEDGTIKPKAKAILDKLDTYSEVSPSGTGIKVFPKAKNPVAIRSKDGKFQQGFSSKKPDLEIEIYYGYRFFTLTGNRLPDYPSTIEDRNQELTEIFKEVFKDRNYFSGPDDAPQRERFSGPVELSPDAAERLHELFAADPTFKAEICTPAPVGKRSDVEFHLCARLWEAGFDEAEIYQIMTSSPQTKWAERDDNYRRTTIKRAVAKVEASHVPHILKLPVKTDDIPVGTVGVDPLFGAVKKLVTIDDTDKNGLPISRRFLAWVSDCAVFIHSETRAFDDAEFMFQGVGAVDKRAVQFTLPAVAVAEPRKFKAACINAFGAKNRFGELNFEMVQQLSQYPRIVKRVEVPAWSENIPLVPGVGLADKVEYRLSSKIPAAVYDGDLQKAKAALRTLLKVHKYAPILVAAVLGSPAIARWHKNERFGVGIWGLTGTLKTSTILACMGMFGIGYLDGPKLKAGKDGSTAVGAMEIFAAAGFLPQPYDNLKTVNQRDIENYVGTTHVVLEGEEKARGKKDGGLRESREFSCTPIITGEVRPSEAATSARVFGLNWTRPNDTLLGEVQQNAALLPIIGYHWLRFLAETDCVLGTDFEAFRSKKMQDFLGLQYVNPGRLATIYTLLVSTWDLLEASPLGDVFTEARESFKAALAEATAVQGQAVSEETEIARFLSGLEELLASNPGLIVSEDGTKTIAGSIIGKRAGKGLFLLPAETLNELGKIRVFNQQPTIDSLTQALNDKGVLIPGKDGHLQYRLRLNGGNPRGWYIKAEAFPVNTETFPPTGNAKNDNERPSVPSVPAFPVKKRERNFSEDLQKNHDGSDDKKHLLENGGNTGNSSVVNRLVDSDLDSIVSVPSSVPTRSHCEDEIDRPTPGKDDPGFQKFKSGMKKRTCLMCGEHFSYDLGIHYNGGYICARCHREGKPLEPAKPDSQTKLELAGTA